MLILVMPGCPFPPSLNFWLLKMWLLPYGTCEKCRTSGIKIWVSTAPPGDSDAQWSLRSTGLVHSYSTFKTLLWCHFLQEGFLIPLPLWGCCSCLAFLKHSAHTLTMTLTTEFCNMGLACLWSQRVARAGLCMSRAGHIGETQETFTKWMREDLCWI